MAEHQAKAPRYRLVGEIARGGMGAILKVWDDDLGRPLAMKVILGQAEAISRGETPEIEAAKLDRFLIEAQITGQLDHPGIVPVHELGIDDEGRLFFTMRLVKGQDLKKVFALLAEEQEGWNRTRALGALQRACEAMAFAHSRGVIHRDLKPANIMVGRFGEVYVMDWGLGRSLDGSFEGEQETLLPAPSPDSIVRTHRAEESGAPDGPLVTQDGDVVGTPAYMSPEQARGELGKIDKRSDVFAMGAVLYHLLTGARPYADTDAATPQALWYLVLAGSPTPIEELTSGVPPELIAVCEKAMARDASGRYADMTEMASDLNAYLENRVVRAYRTGAIAELKKWVVRNRAIASALAGLLFVLGLSGYAVAAISARRSLEQERHAFEQSIPNLIAEVEALYPIHPDRAPAMRDWLSRAKTAVEMRSTLSDELEDLREAGTVREMIPTASDSLRKQEAMEATALVRILEARLQGAQVNLREGTSSGREKREDLAAVKILSVELPRLQAEAGVMNEAAMPRVHWSFQDEQLKAKHDRSAKCVSLLDRLVGDQGLIAQLETRLARAESLRQISLDQEREAWGRAQESITSADSVYAGLTLDQQLGLVPLRRDPESGLWEFWHALSGERPEPIPEGGYRMTGYSGLVFVLVPASTFMMGAQSESPNLPNYDLEARPSEGPPFEISLDAYLLSKYEMTQGQWGRLGGGYPSDRFAGMSATGNPRFSALNPVEHVSWRECHHYLNRWGLSLPSEAQWECAARAGTSFAYGGTSLFEDIEPPVNFKDADAEHLSTVEGVRESRESDGFSAHAPIDTFGPNRFGFYQMLGNVAEWVADAYCYNFASGANLLSVSGGTGELVPDYSGARTVRGGHCESDPVDLRVSRRTRRKASYNDRVVGVRPRLALRIFSSRQ